ncbi:MAG: dTDP-3-amino-3,4,6-trideoxy-alpha-D-glucose transaminase [Gammaproteobacteria bacterium]|nr:dTDP-3-amino-3,4,6-trideoxy-alpha-D-glucose transaminase [Gammaproteobacteria bacterium]
MNEIPVPFLDLKPEFEALEHEWLEAIRRIGMSGAFILGPEVHAFEREFADYIGAPYSVSVASGTDALILSLKALNIGAGDEVITTPYSFFATAEVISRTGATPVFVDIDPVSFNLDIDRVQACINARTRAILPVHLFGCPVDMGALQALADGHGIPLIEDCAQACGAVHKTRRVGGWGDFGCFSFYPTKVLGCYGDGGIITIQDPGYVEKIKKLRNHGAGAAFVHEAIGYNSRLDEIQAALLRIKMRSLNDRIDKRRQVAVWYDKGFAGSDVITPGSPYGEHVYNLYTIRASDRDRVRDRLESARIGFNLCYRVPLHRQRVYLPLEYAANDLPNTEKASRECISLPIHPYMTEDQVQRVVDVVLATG